MQDLLLKQGPDGSFDIAIDGSDFATVDGFETAILVSLFTDARAPAALVSQAISRRGWVGNILTADIGRDLGSILWTYEQTRLDTGTLTGLQNAAQLSLSWMIEDSIAQNVSVEVDRTNIRSVTVGVRIVGQSNAVSEYSAQWLATDLSQSIT